jgi:hypothetical protein
MGSKVNNSRFEFLVNKLVYLENKLTIDELYRLVKADPTSIVHENISNELCSDFYDKIKAGSYVNWLIKQYLSLPTKLNNDIYDEYITNYKNLFMEDLYKVSDDLKKFHRYKNKIKKEDRDINKHTVDSLYDLVKNFDLLIAITTKAERRSTQIHLGSEMIYESEKWVVIEINNHGELGREAACFYGGYGEETRWCTSSPGGNMFNRYIKDGPIFVLFNPKDTLIYPKTGLPVNRFQFHFESDQFKDKDNKCIDLVHYFNNDMSELKNLFKSFLIRNIYIHGNKLEIDDLSNNKFISIYGVNSLFDELPNNLEEIQINYNNNSNYIFDIPESISRLKNLKMILFNNCVKNIPDSICELNELRFLSLTNNKELKEIPNSILNIEKFKFLNLTGSDNVKLPEIINDRCVKLGQQMWQVKN